MGPDEKRLWLLATAAMMYWTLVLDAEDRAKYAQSFYQATDQFMSSPVTFTTESWQHLQKSGAALFLILAALSKLIAMFFKRRNRRRAAQVEMQEQETTAEDDDDDKKAKEEETTTKRVKQRRGKA